MKAKTKESRSAGMDWHDEILDTIEHHLYVVGMGDVNRDMAVLFADKMFLVNTLWPNDRDVVDTLARFILALHSGSQPRRNNSIEAHVHALNEFLRAEVAREQRSWRAEAKGDGAVTDEQYRRCLGILSKIYEGDLDRLDRMVATWERNFKGFSGFIARARLAAGGVQKKNG